MMTREIDVSPARPERSGDAESVTTPGRTTLAEAEGDVDLFAERVGAVEEEAPDVVADVETRDLEAGKSELAASAPPPVEAQDVAGEAPKDSPGGGDDGPVSPEVAAAVESAQQDAREATAAAEAETQAYKTEVGARRDRFEAEQTAVVSEQLRAMSTTEKRSTLVEMGMDKKAVKKMTDAQVAAAVEGKIATEQRKTKIMGMEPGEIAGLSIERKIQHLVDLGIDRGDLDKVGPQKAARLFDDVMKLAHVPGKHQVKIKIKGGLLGKSWTVSIDVDAEGNAQIDAKKEGGFLSKLWGWVKLALPIVLVCLAPFTGGASLLVLAAYQAAIAIKNGDWLGLVMAVAGGITGFSAAVAAKGAATAATTLTKIAAVAEKVKKVADVAKAAMLAAKAKNAGSLVAALASGASAFAGFASEKAQQFKDTMERWSKRLDRWSKMITGGQKVVKGIKDGKPLVALGGALDVAAAGAGTKTPLGQNLTRASAVTGHVEAARVALAAKPPDYGAVAQAGLGIATQLSDDRRVEDAAKITQRARALQAAWAKRDEDPGAVADAALGLAEAIQTAKYDFAHDAPKDGATDPGREAITKGYQRATRIVKAAAAAATAAAKRPRPDYLGALDGATQLVAELTEDKRLDAAAVITQKLEAWTAAVNSKDERAIVAAGVAFGDALEGLRGSINAERDRRKQEAQAQQVAPEVVADDGGTIPSAPQPVPLEQLGPVGTPMPDPSAPDEPLRFEEEITVHGDASPTAPRAPTPGVPNGPLGTPPPAPVAKPAPKISSDVDHVVKLVALLAELHKEEGFGSVAGVIGAWNALIAAEKAAREAKNYSELLHAQAKAAVVAIEKTGALANTIAKDYAYWAKTLANVDVSQDTLRAFERFQKNLGRLARAGGIPLAFIEAGEKALTAFGYAPDPSKPPSMIQRLDAARELVGLAAQLPRDLKWLAEVGGILLKKLGTAAAPIALDAVRAAARKLPAEVGAKILAYLEPLILKAGQVGPRGMEALSGTGAGRQVASQVAAVIDKWAIEYLAFGRRLAAREVLQHQLVRRLTTDLASKLGLALRLGGSVPFGIAGEVVHFENMFMEYLYASARDAFGTLFTPYLFGRSIVTLKNEINAQPMRTRADCEAFYAYAFHRMLNGATYEIKGHWLPYAWAHRLADACTAIKGSTDPISVLRAQPDDMQQILAMHLRNDAIAYIDQEARAVFAADAA